MIPEDERRQYAARQYESLRAECAQARDAQNSILQWNQAVAGTLYAAGIVAATANNGRYVVAARLIFGLVIPAVLLGGALAWAGEMIRMERTGVYLRSFERAAWEIKSDDGLADTSFFIWENLLWSPPKPFYDSGYRKQNTGYAGVAIFYGVMYVGSLVALFIFAPFLLGLIACIALLIFGGALMIPPAIQIFSLGGAAPSVSEKELAAWARNLQDQKPTLAQSATLQHIKVAATDLLKEIRRFLRRKP